MNASVAMQVAVTKRFGDLEIQVYENPEVGHTKAQDDFWMTREQVGAALEYDEPRKRIAVIHSRNKDRLDPLSRGFQIETPSGIQTMVCYSLKGVMEICRFSKQPKANAFIDFCWDVIAALMRGETVSLKANQAELKRQERFEKMTQTLIEIHSKMDAFEAARQQDRNALDNVLFVCKQLDRKLASTSQQPEQATQTPKTEQSATQNPSKTYKGRSEWRTEIYNLVNKITALSGLTLNCVLHQGYDYLSRNYGWYFKDARKDYIKRVGYQGSVSNISGLDVIEASEMYKSIFMSIMKDRYEAEKHDAEVKKGIKGALTKKPALIPADMLPKRHKVEPVEEAEDFPQSGGDMEIVAEAQAVEIEEVEESVETTTVVQKRKNYYTKPRAEILRPIIEPVAKKLGDKTSGYWKTYQKVYDVVGVSKMDRMRRTYTRIHGKPPKAKMDVFMESDKSLKLFKDAVKKVST